MQLVAVQGNRSLFDTFVPWLAGNERIWLRNTPNLKFRSRLGLYMFTYERAKPYWSSLFGPAYDVTTGVTGIAEHVPVVLASDPSGLRQTFGNPFGLIVV